MTAEFDPSLNAAANLRQAAVVEIDLARDALGGLAGDDPHAGIHAARKALKRARALLRLARPALGKPVYRAENARLRDAGRCLSMLRDARALVDTFDALEAHYAGRVDFSRMLPLRTALAAELVGITLQRAALNERVAQALAMLDGAAAAAPRWPLDDAGPAKLARGLGRTHRRARKAWKRARRAHDPETLHDWRKRAKYLRHMYEFMADVDDDAADSSRSGFHALADVLGDHHDLEVLRAHLDAMGDSRLDAVAESELRVLLRERQDALYARALALGEPLLSTRPKKVRRRVRDALASALPD